MRTTFTIVALTCLCGCAAERDTTLAILDVTTRRRVEFDGTALRVVALDATGEKGKTVWRRELTDAERRFLSERINDPVLRTLDDDYQNEDVWDGWSFGFQIKQSGRPTFGTGATNVRVGQLVSLADAVDVMLPDEHRVNYRRSAEERSE